MARVVQRDEVTVDDSLIQPNQQDQCRFHKHRDYPSDKLGIVLTLKLAKSLEYRFVEHGNTAAFLHHVPCHRLVPLLMLLEPKRSAGPAHRGGFQRDDVIAADAYRYGRPESAAARSCHW